MATGARPLRRAVSAADKDQRRAAILAAAKRVFAQHGYHGTTMADVAKAAELSYGAIYWYFDSKDALFHALMEAEEAALRTCITDALAGVGSTDPAAVLRPAVQATFEFFEGDRAATRLLFRDSPALGGAFERHLYGIYERFIADLDTAIAAGQHAGLLRAAPSRMVAFALAALIGQIALRRLSTDDGLDAATLADFVVTLVMDGLRAR